MPDPGAITAAVADSRRRLLGALAGAEDLTFIRTIGNLGDHLIWAGARRLLANVPHREVSLAEALRTRGHTACLSGSGGWCAPHHLLAELLPSLEERFARFIVLPSSYDPSVPEVHLALAKSSALFFARERVSHQRIAGLCRSDIAHDTAFFFDFDGFRRLEGSGALDAFRTDAEAAAGSVTPPGNRDISVECGDLDEWLATITRHSTVRTDRAHVMIAAALLGKRVEIRAGSYHKVTAIADYALANCDLHRLPAPRSDKSPDPEGGAVVRAFVAGLPTPPAGRLVEQGRPRVTAVVATRDRPDSLRRCLSSLSTALRGRCPILVVDDGSREVERERTAEVVRAAGCTLVRLEVPGGCALARRVAFEQVETPFVFSLDDDAEVFPGTLERLVEALDTRPEALAAMATVALPNGQVHLAGGHRWEDDGVVYYQLKGSGLPVDEVATPGVRECAWISLGATLARRAAFRDEPLDGGMSGYYEDFEWCLRTGRDPGRFVNVGEAVVLHHHVAKAVGPPIPSTALRFAPSIARLYKRHGLIIQNLFDLIPTLRTLEGDPDLGRARLFLEITAARGAPWMTVAWAEGELDLLLQPVLGAPPPPPVEVAAEEPSEAFVQRLALREAADEVQRLQGELDAIHGSRWWRMASRYWKLRRLAGRLAGRRREDHHRSREAAGGEAGPASKKMRLW